MDDKLTLTPAPPLSDPSPPLSAYVPWKEGADLLGLQRSAFFYLVRTRQISEEPGRGPRDGRYSLADILALKERRAQGKRRKTHRKRPAPVLLDWLAPTDIPAILRLDLRVYHEMYLAEASVYREWSEKNPQLAMAAFDARSDRQEMLAYVAALPLTEDVILAILRGEREETSITMEEIQSYERLGSYTLLANSAVTVEERPDLLYKVLDRMMAAWIDRWPDRYITKIYAQSTSKRGDMLVQHFFMQPRYDLAYNAYEVDLARTSASRIIRRFQSRLQEKASPPSELQQEAWEE